MVTINKCKFPHDLSYAIKQLEVDIGDRLVANQALLAAAESTLTGMDALIDEGNNLLDTLLSKNGAGTASASSIVTSADVATQYGLLPDKPTAEEEEKFVANAGLVLLNRIVYLPGDKSDNPLDAVNISVLRRLYFALGKDLSKVDEVFTQTTKTVFIQDQLVLKIIPPKSVGVSYTIDEIRTLLKQNQIEDTDVAFTSDKRAIVILESFLARDQAKTKTLGLTKIPEAQLISNVFHQNGVDTSTIAMQRYAALGYTSEELNTIMLGKDLIDTNKITIVNKVDVLHENASKLIMLIDFIISRLASSITIGTNNYSTFFTQLNLGIDQLIVGHQSLISLLKFQVSQYLEKNILTKLREKHSDTEIIYLLERRQDVQGIYFDPPDDTFLRTLSRSISAATPDTTYISNQAINKPSTSKYDQASVLAMYVDLVDSQTELDTRTYSIASLNKIKAYLNDYIGRTPIITNSFTTSTTTNPTEILQGQPSAASPASILTERFDPLTTMNFDQRKKNVLGSFQDLYGLYPPSLAGPISDVITATTNIFEKVFKAVDSIISQAEKTLFAMKKRLDSWLSKHMSLTGKGDFSSSLLKCSINWDIGISTNLLDQLIDFVLRLLATAVAFLTKIKAWIFDIITKLLCLPVNLINSFIGKVQNALPSACKVSKVDLGDTLNKALADLNKVGTAKTITLMGFDKDALKLKMSISAAPDRLGQFKESAFCDSSASSNFMNASMLNMSVGI